VRLSGLLMCAPKRIYRALYQVFKTFRGELVPQDPNDEPASVLLEKIKAEKARPEVAKKKGTKQQRSTK